MKFWHVELWPIFLIKFEGKSCAGMHRRRRICGLLLTALLFSLVIYKDVHVTVYYLYKNNYHTTILRNITVRRPHGKSFWLFPPEQGNSLKLSFHSVCMIAEVNVLFRKTAVKCRTLTELGKPLEKYSLFRKGYSGMRNWDFCFHHELKIFFVDQVSGKCLELVVFGKKILTRATAIIASLIVANMCRSNIFLISDQNAISIAIITVLRDRSNYNEYRLAQESFQCYALYHNYKWIVIDLSANVSLRRLCPQKDVIVFFFSNWLDNEL